MKMRNRRTLPKAGRLLDSLRVKKRHVEFEPFATIFSQGDRCSTVMYVRKGRIKLSVVSQRGKEAVVAILEAGSFFGEGALAGQPRRIATAEAMTASTITMIETAEMRRQLHHEGPLSDRFLSHMLARNIRIEEDLIDQLFNSSEKRLARALLLLARYGEQETPRPTVAKISQELLAEMIGTNRSSVNFFMNKFRKLGFIEYSAAPSGGLQIHRSLLSVVLHD
jgi:CRP/FNR family cyclic AMP-dependent transcriptional regulator